MEIRGETSREGKSQHRLKHPSAVSKLVRPGHTMLHAKLPRRHSYQPLGNGSSGSRQCGIEGKGNIQVAAIGFQKMGCRGCANQ